MESLHAPWRIQYILTPKPESTEDSLFTRIAQSDDDVGNHVIARDRTCYAVLNKYPYNGGHLMVVPYKETDDLNALTDEELCDLMKMVRRCQNALTQIMMPTGFNIGINLGRGQAPQHIQDTTGLAEGASTAQVLAEMARSRGVDTPIVNAVADVIEQRKSVGAAIESLLARPFKAEV
jgi:hypothetical protein